MDGSSERFSVSNESLFRECLFAQLEEIMQYKWFLGESMRRDPLEVMSMDEICLQWIEKYAAQFREHRKRLTDESRQ